MKSYFVSTSLLAAVLVTAPLASAHTGRRFEVKVIGDQLVAQGYNSAGVDDGGGIVRPYVNAIHDHWANSLVATAATATLPGYDIDPAATQLEGHDVIWTLNRAWKWVGPPMMPPDGTVPTETALANEVFITRGLETVSTVTPGSITLVGGYDGVNGLDLDLSYTIGIEPSSVIYVFEGTLWTTAPGIADSETVYTILSPDGATMAERLHHASLYLEEYLAVPEPGSLTLLGLSGLVVLARRRRA